MGDDELVRQFAPIGEQLELATLIAHRIDSGSLASASQANQDEYWPLR
jgi:hypothetical protein